LFARRPCLSAFRDERALPSGLFGPRDFAPFLRLASARALLMIAARARAWLSDSAALVRAAARWSSMAGIPG
jgi:hypothetical protein